VTTGHLIKNEADKSDVSYVLNLNYEFTFINQEKFTLLYLVEIKLFTTTILVKLRKHHRNHSGFELMLPSCVPVKLC
jgi:hypothetical protein